MYVRESKTLLKASETWLSRGWLKKNKVLCEKCVVVINDEFPAQSFKETFFGVEFQRALKIA